MEILIDGNRTTSESWMEASRVSKEALPPLTQAEMAVAAKLSISVDDYRRSKFAATLTNDQLKNRSEKLAEFIRHWLSAHGYAATIARVWLKTFEGQFRIDVNCQGRVESIRLNEDLVNDLFEFGSKDAQASFGRLMEVNFPQKLAHAS